MKVSTSSQAVCYLSKKDKRLASVIDAIGDIECNEDPDAFTFIVKQIIGQMLSNKAANCIRGRIAEMIGGEFSPDALLKLTQEELHSAGMSRNKADYLLGFSTIIAEGRLNLDALSLHTNEEILKRLTAIRGIGQWTAKMYLIFVLKREDVLPFEDGAFMQSFRWLYELKNPSKRAVIKLCRKWKTYSSIAARYLYRALDMGFTKYEYHVFNSRIKQ